MRGNRVKPKLFISRLIPDEGLNVLRARFELSVNLEDKALSKEGLAQAVVGKEALLCCVTDTVDEEVIAGGDKLRVIAVFGAGYDNIDVDFATQRRVWVINIPDKLTEPTADLTWALLLALARQIIRANNLVKSGQWEGWDPKVFYGNNIFGKTLGIIGFGRIGQAVAQRALGFKMSILYHDIIRRGEAIERELSVRYVPLDELLASSDFLSVNASLAVQSHHLIGRRELELMRPSAYLINTSRGAIIDDRALLEILKSNRIAGAALDVFENEPHVNPDFFKLEKVILTPHIGTAIAETRLEMATAVAEDIISALQGKIPVGAVNYVL